MCLFDSMMLALAGLTRAPFQNAASRDSRFSCEKTSPSIIRHCLLLMILK